MSGLKFKRVALPVHLKRASLNFAIGATTEVFAQRIRVDMLTDDNFARLVAEDVKNRVSTEQADYLRLPENMSRWKRSLQLLLVNLDSQLDELATKEDLEVRRYQGLGGEGVNLLAEVQTVIEQRRRKVIKFRFHVEKRLDEVIRLSNAVSKDEVKQSGNYNLLRSAIQKHKELLLDEDFFATLSDADQDLIDEALWASLDGVWAFDEVESMRNRQG